MSRRVDGVARRVYLPARQVTWSAAAALWAGRELARTRHRLRRDGAGAVAPTPPVRLPRAGTRGVLFAMRFRGATCLERSLILQGWYAAHDVGVDVVIGVRPGASAVAAHAWIETPGTPSAEGAGYEEIHRMPARY